MSSHMERKKRFSPRAKGAKTQWGAPHPGDDAVRADRLFEGRAAATSYEGKKG
jgi:hypothetical protein